MTRIFFLIAAMSLPLSAAHAEGSVDAVKAAVKAACSKDLSTDEALRLVPTLMLKCSPGDKADAAGCQVECLKKNKGAVVGSGN